MHNNDLTVISFRVWYWNVEASLTRHSVADDTTEKFDFPTCSLEFCWSDFGDNLCQLKMEATPYNCSYNMFLLVLNGDIIQVRHFVLPTVSRLYISTRLQETFEYILTMM